MKNKMICALLTTVMVLSFAACGSQGNAAASAESTVTSESGAKASTVESSAAEASAETTTEVSADAANGTSYEDNFAVSTEDAAAFAKKIQDAVAAEDLNALADLVNYPVYEMCIRDRSPHGKARICIFSAVLPDAPQRISSV